MAHAPNSRRARRIDLVLAWTPDWDAPPEGLIDLLADARHWCDRHGQDYARLDRLAPPHHPTEPPPVLGREP